MPKLSIITVTFNCRSDLEATLKSIDSQKFIDYEHIFVDGGSTDGTLDLIKSREASNIRWISERDNGIYDAMNKGVDLAQGEYLQFLNAGDIYFDEDSLNYFEKSLLKSSWDAIYGETIIADKNYNQVFHVKPKGFELFVAQNFGTACVNHQSFFIKKEKTLKYSDKYKLKSELNWYIETLKAFPDITTYYIKEPLIRYKLGGAGNLRYKSNLREWVTIVQRHFGLMQNLKNIPRYRSFLKYNKKIRLYVYDTD